MDRSEKGVCAAVVAASWSRLGSIGYAVCAAAVAQAPQPFLAPQLAAHDTASVDITSLDANRDGQDDVLAPGLFFGSLLVSLDEHGATLESSLVQTGAITTSRNAIMLTPVAVEGADLDGDGVGDLVFVTSDGAVYVQYNFGVGEAG